MNRIIIPNIIRFVVIVLVQVLILERLNLHGYINPYLYPLIIIMLPIEIAHWALILIGFSLGLAIDTFTNTIGIHAATCVFIAFIRPYILNALTPSGGYEQDDKPTTRSLGFRWYISYAVTIIFVHHFILFFLEVLRFSYLFHTLTKIAVSSLISLMLVIIAEYISVTKRRAT